MIFYFSCTGNTLWLARQLAAATGERLVDMAAALYGNGAAKKDGDGSNGENYSCTLSEGERIGFCFPIHGWQPPALVRRFISGLRLPADAAAHYCYTFCTCGDETGLAMDLLNDDLQAVGLHAASVFSVVMPETYVALPFMLTDTPQREREKIDSARAEIAVCARLITERRSGVSRLHRGAMPWLLTHVIGAFFNRCMITDRPFKVDASRCTSCGRCAQVCPVGNIDGGPGRRPAWKHDGRCTACLSCYHHCPVHAIGYGPLTRRRGQYYFGIRHNPDNIRHNPDNI